MQRHGFIHSMMDVKVLILYVTARVRYPVDEQKIYELCYQDECLSYFDVCEAIPQMVLSGHLLRQEDGAYSITEKGRETATVIEDSLAYPVAQRAKRAVESFNREVKRSGLIRAEILPQDNGDYAVVMGLDDAKGSLMTLELMAPSQQQARKLEHIFREHAEEIFQTIITVFLEEDDTGVLSLGEEKSEFLEHHTPEDGPKDDDS